MVDFSLASTYIPGILCLLRTSLLTIIMSREWATHSIPTLILLGIFLYVDRIVRQEVIFDSSALTCTLFVAHLLNICRSKIAHVDPLVAIAASQGTNSSTIGPAASSPPLGISSQSWWVEQQVIFVAYSAVSTLLLLNIDVSAIALPSKSASFSCFAPIVFHPSEASHCLLRVSTIVLHCLFVGALLQIPVGKDDFMVAWKIMARSFSFLVLSLSWTYAVGIRESCLQMRTYPYFYNPVLQASFFL